MCGFISMFTLHLLSVFSLLINFIKQTHESHQSNYQWNRTELFKSSKRQPTKRSSTITTTVHRSSIVDKNVPNDRHVSDPVHFYQVNYLIGVHVHLCLVIRNLKYSSFKVVLVELALKSR